MFLQCPKLQEILLWIGKTQHYMGQWHTCTDIVQFSLSLNKTDRAGFLLVYSAICWTIWKYRNEIIFRNSTPKSARNLIFLIISLVEYWTGSVPKKVKEAVLQNAVLCGAYAAAYAYAVGNRICVCGWKPHRKKHMRSNMRFRICGRIFGRI